MQTWHQGSGKKPEPFFNFYLAIIEAAMMRLQPFERDGGAATVRLCAVTHC
ncbi:hypothetical protein Bphyt_0800 [Paraburkholderia phytofirmans PsJN]|uniref:Uncharacterized protein n=1 Tax=Paraburkholderia phytofirmans (strain DSM 17436 / LMG 22146 / PsJN) TaxID=398527 RepID=B2T0B8_PARPJ|nr:hypothetical protein Bphyt_0800 [Paraburkholderia phytofirmans PsJN]